MAEITRRDALKSILAAGAAALVPSWLAVPHRQAIDLKPFCNAREDRYAMAQPFIQESAEYWCQRRYHRYATNGRICARLPADEHDRQADSGLKLPPASTLDWSHDRRRGWSPWPQADYRLARGSECPACGGWGVTRVEGDCSECGGLGQVYIAGIELAGQDCKSCLATGNAGPRCRKCSGNGVGRFPGIQFLGNQHIEATYDRQVRTLGPLEFYVPANVGEPIGPNHRPQPILFRFDGGLGLICATDRQTALRRMEDTDD